MNNPLLQSLWAMLQNFMPIYELAAQLQAFRTKADLLGKSQSLYDPKLFKALLGNIQNVCTEYGFAHTSELAKRSMKRPPAENYRDVSLIIDHLNDSLTSELEKEAICRIPPERKNYFEHDYLFGKEVAAAFPSCSRDIQKAGSCYALGQEDACVHHLMLVLERGLNALAAEVGVPYEQINWQPIIDRIGKQAKLLPRGTQRDFYLDVNAQFGFLKNAYRNHSQHAHDDPYDLEKALSILKHVRGFMQELEKGGVSEM